MDQTTLSVGFIIVYVVLGMTLKWGFNIKDPWIYAFLYSLLGGTYGNLLATL